MYTWTKTIATPYGHSIKVVFYRNDLTGTYTAGEGFITSIGDISKGVDAVTGEYKPGAVNIQMRNTDNNLTDYLFAGISPFTTVIQMEIWVSFNAGTTWENEFVGFVETETLYWQMSDSVETRNRAFSVHASDALLSLKTTSVQTAALTAAGYYETPPTQTARLFSVGKDLQFVEYTGAIDISFVSLSNILLSCILNIPWVKAPDTTAVDVTACEHKGKNDHNAREYSVGDWHVIANHANRSGFDWAYQYEWAQSKLWGEYPSGLANAKNAQEVVKIVCNSLLTVPIPTYTVSGATTAYVLRIEPRYPSAPTAIAAGLGEATKFTRANGQYIWGGQVTNISLPYNFISPANAKGASMQVENRLISSLDATGNADQYVMVDAHIQPAGSAEIKKCYDILAWTVFGKAGSDSFNNIHRMKYATAQSYRALTPSPDYYAAAECIYDLAMNPLGSAYSAIGYRNAFDVEYKRIKTTSLADVRIMKSITLEGTACTIYEVVRNVTKNTTVIKAMKT